MRGDFWERETDGQIEGEQQQQKKKLITFQEWKKKERMGTQKERNGEHTEHRLDDEAHP